MPVNVAQYLADQAVSRPRQPALRAPAGRLPDGSIRYTERSFSELEGEASAVAYLLGERGVVRGTRVLLMVKPGLDLIRIVFALFKIGAVPVVIDPGMGIGSFLRCVRHSRPEVLIGLPPAVWLARLRRRSFRAVREKIAVGRQFEARLRQLSGLGAFPVADSRAAELAAILFTSGSTGPAKGVCYTHGMFAAQLEMIRQQYGIAPGEVDLPMLPVFALFNPALGMCTIVPEMNPGRPARVDPAVIVAAITQNKVTNSFGSPAIWSRIARYCQSRDLYLPSLRRILMAGAPVPPALMEQMRAIIPNGEIFSPYGATEALPVSSIAASDVLNDTAARTDSGEGTCVGQPLPGVRVRIINPVDGAIASIAETHSLASGRIGEIIVQGSSVTKGYDNLPQADAVSKITDGEDTWHRMGDMGWLEENGRLWFCGRKAERVMTANGPLYTDCCEAIFNRHPRVYRSALIELGAGSAGIVIEPEEGAMPTGADEKEVFIKSLLELGALNDKTVGIRHFFFQKSFPVDVRHNAKIHRLSLARRYGIS